MRATTAALTLVALAAVLGTGCGSDDEEAERGPDGRVLEAGPVSVFDLLEGDCTSPPDEVRTGLERIDVVPCSEPHTQEVFAVLEYEIPDDGNDDFPGDNELETYAEAACLDPFADYVDVDYIDSSLFITFLLPTVTSWNEEGDREIVCFAQTTGEQLEASVEGSQR